MLSEEDKERNFKELSQIDLQCKGCYRQIKDKILILLVRKDKTNCNYQKSKNEHNKFDKELKMSSNSTNYNSFKTNSMDHLKDSHHPSQPEIYHIHCLNCFECGDRLSFADEKCWIYQENKIICFNCRTRYKHCGRCRLQVPEDTKVHKLNRVPFHITCFTCFQCGRQLYQGDKCGIFNNDVFCYEHYMNKCLTWKILNLDSNSLSKMNQIDPGQVDKLQQFLFDQEIHSISMNEEKVDRNFNQDHGHFPNNRHKSDRITMMTTNCGALSTSLSFKQSMHSNETTDCFLTSTNYPTVNNLLSISNSPSTTTTTFTNMNSIENCQTTTDNWCSIDESMLNEEILLNNGEISLTMTENGHSVDSSTSSNCSVHSKSKRIRTSFTPDQLAILQANFDIEANPDGQELERIAGIAKLNKRVTQVWFQNARARKKKIECRGNLEGQHDQLGFNSLTCCLTDPMGIEEFYDNSKENIPSMNEINEGILSVNNNDGMNVNQIYGREYNCKSDCFNGNCMTLSDTIPNECDDSSERMNPMKNSLAIKNAATNNGINNHGCQNNNTASVNISTTNVIPIENSNGSSHSQNSTLSTRNTVRPNLCTDQNMFSIIPSNYHMSNNFYFPAVALPTN